MKDWVLKTKVLQTEKMLGSHTGVNLAHELDSAITRWGIAGKAVTLCEGCDIKVGCFAHTLHLAAGKTSDLARPFAKWIRPTVAFFHRSHVGAEVFGEMQERLGYVKHKLIINVKIRWLQSLPYESTVLEIR